MEADDAKYQELSKQVLALKEAYDKNLEGEDKVVQLSGVPELTSTVDPKFAEAANDLLNVARSAVRELRRGVASAHSAVWREIQSGLDLNVTNELTQKRQKADEEVRRLAEDLRVKRDDLSVKEYANDRFVNQARGAVQ